MNKPEIAEKFPVEVELEAGKPYLWCTCGKSSTQPFCDSSHGPDDSKPQLIKVEETKKYWLCQCKHTDNQPFCDGSHKSL